MTRAKAIRMKCLDCTGESTKEVTLCPILDCPLWKFRTGSHTSAKDYKSRIAIAKIKYAKEFQGLEKSGIDVSKY